MFSGCPPPADPATNRTADRFDHNIQANDPFLPNLTRYVDFREKLRCVQTLLSNSLYLSPEAIAANAAAAAAAAAASSSNNATATNGTTAVNGTDATNDNSTTAANNTTDTGGGRKKRSLTGDSTAQWESARPNLDLPKIEARTEVSA